MKITLRRDLHPDTLFYYNQQFKIYHEPYLIWDRETWEAVLTIGDVYRIEVDGRDAGDVILEDRAKGKKYVVDFSILPEYQKKGVGKRALALVIQMGRELTALARKEALDFFLKSGFVLKRTIKNYYFPGVDGYYIIFRGKARTAKKSPFR